MGCRYLFHQDKQVVVAKDVARLNLPSQLFFPYFFFTFLWVIHLGWQFIVTFFMLFCYLFSSSAVAILHWHYYVLCSHKIYVYLLVSSLLVYKFNLPAVLITLMAVYEAGKRQKKRFILDTQRWEIFFWDIREKSLFYGAHRNFIRLL